MAIARKIEVRPSDGPHITVADLRAFMAELEHAPGSSLVNGSIKGFHSHLGRVWAEPDADAGTS